MSGLSPLPPSGRGLPPLPPIGDGRSPSPPSGRPLIDQIFDDMKQHVAKGRTALADLRIAEDRYKKSAERCKETTKTLQDAQAQAEVAARQLQQSREKEAASKARMEQEQEKLNKLKAILAARKAAAQKVDSK